MKLIVKLGAATAIMACTLTGGLAMAQPYDDPGYDAIQRQRVRDYCYNHPYSDRCEKYRYRLHRAPRHYDHSDRCVGSMVHSVGKAWIPHTIAQNSAIKAWEKETRVEFGAQYADWDNAESKSMTCGPSGTGLGQLCEAKGRPCR
jgi:hypothetical protein